MQKLQVAIIAVASFAAPALATDWQIDPSHTTAEFTVKHMMVTNVKGQFGKVTGSVKTDDKDVTKGTIEATIDATSIDTREPKRDAHLKSGDFFDVEKFPTLTFKSTKIQKAGNNKLKVSGDLTIHGVTKPVTLAVEMGTKDYKDPFQGMIHRGATATTTINRKDFGLVWNKPLEAGGIMVGEDVSITVDVELVKPGETPAKG